MYISEIQKLDKEIEKIKSDITEANQRKKRIKEEFEKERGLLLGQIKDFDKFSSETLVFKARPKEIVNEAKLTLVLD